MIILINNPISIVKDEVYRCFTEFKHDTCIKYVKNIILRMMELVDDKILAELKVTTCGVIIHDG